MKVYTEVNYIWKDNKLVQTDSKSFDYEGEVESCHWYHRHSTTVTIPSVPDIVDAYKGSDIDKGLTSGQSAITKGWEKIKKDNPNPNLNIQTPDKLLDKGRDAWHDAMDNAKQFWDKNSDSLNFPDENDDFTTTPTSNPLLEEDTEAGTRGTAAGRKTLASGETTSARRGINKLNRPRSLINQQIQKRLV